jgi:glyoxylase-like metal-dependent hydrolase (beta-lactamase superfamily II)
MSQALSQAASPEALHAVLENIWRWSVFSEEKQFYFNGYALISSGRLILIDPPSADPAILQALTHLGGQPEAILLTNRDHEREAATLKDALNIPIWIHEADAPLVSLTADKTYTHGDTLPGGLTVIALAHQKSPGESAFWQQTTGRLFLGDALIGKPAGALSMLPDDKYADPVQARTGLQTLVMCQDEVQALLLGDGEPILSNATAVLKDTLARLKG